MLKTYENHLEIKVHKELDYQDLKDKYKISDKLFTSLYKNRKILVNGSFRRKGLGLKESDLVSMYYLEEEDLSRPWNRALDIVYEDENLLIVNKPYAINTHRTRYDQEETLENMLRAYFIDLSINRKVRFINRLDKDTEGLIIVGKNPYIAALMSEMIKNKEVNRSYLLKVKGYLDQEEGRIDLPIYKEEAVIKRRIDSRGKKSITDYRVISRENGYSLIEAKLVTGRTHQLRIHFAAIGHPIIGDSIYGDSADRLYLKSYSLSFKNPLDKRQIALKLTGDFKK